MWLSRPFHVVETGAEVPVCVFKFGIGILIGMQPFNGLQLVMKCQLEFFRVECCIK